MLRRVPLLTVILALVLGGVSRAGVSDELSFVAGYSTADYGANGESDTRSFTVRYVRGNAVRFRAELPMLQVRNVGTVVRTGHGPSPLGHHGQGSSSGPGGNGSDGRDGATVGSGTGDWMTGAGDLRLAATRSLAGGGVKLFRVDVGAQVKAPTADEEEGFGTGEWDMRAGMSGEYRFWSVSAFGGAGWNRLGDPSWIDLNDGLDAYFGLEGVAFAERVTVAGWIDGYEETVDGVGAAGVVGLEVRGNRRPGWRGAITVGLGGAAEDLRVMFGYSLSPGGASLGYRGMLR
jgi:hypothetical protein